jgi:two-component system sensor histidine kinase PilS (NtrC family)
MSDTISEPPQNDATIDINPRGRLEGLMLFRVVLVTLFFGGALAINIDSISDLSSFSNITILGLIVGTYVLTILYSTALRHSEDLLMLARGQIAMDVIITGLLVTVTGGLRSVFVFLFLFNIFNAALVIGRRAAVVTALAIGAFFGLLVLLETRTLPHPAALSMLPEQPLRATLFQSLVFTAAGFAIAFLSGYLSNRLGDVEIELRQRRVDVADLKALNSNILASISSGLVTVDLDGDIIFFNRAAAEITGMEKREVLARPLEDVFPHIASMLDEHHDEATPPPPREQDGRRFEEAFTRPDGTTVHLGFSFSGLLDSRDHRVGQIVIFQDLGEIKRLEEIARRSERLAAVGQLAASIAHEIRNPLASISGSVQMLQMTDTLEEDDQRLLGIVDREVDRLEELIRSFLEYSRPRPLQLAERNVVELIEEVLELFRNRPAHHAIDIDVAIPDDANGEEFVASIDEQAIHQILWNLLKNAAEAMEEAGVERPRICVECFRADGQLVLAVEDDGPGIHGAEFDRIFQPFFTTKAEGTGLGLATSYRLVEEHGGQMSLASPEYLDGARFEIELPVETSSSARQER